MTDKLTDEALEKMAALYDRRVAQHDGLKDLLCGQLRSENGQQTRDIHAATAIAIRELLAHRRDTPADDLRAAEVVRDVARQMEIAGYYDAADYMRSEWMKGRIAAALAQKGDA